MKHANSSDQEFYFQPSIQVCFGAGQLEMVGQRVREKGLKTVLLVTDPGIREAGHLDVALQALAKAEIEVHIFDQVIENPTTREVENGLQKAKSIQGLEMIIALGGGSAMDCAKGINFLYSNGGEMEDYWGYGKAEKPFLPSIGIPTTAGTGSEAQSFALISRLSDHRKMACGDVKARFDDVLLDSSLLDTAPKAVIAASAMDAVSHAIESAVCLRRNPVSLMFSREAWRLLDHYFDTIFSQPSLSDWGNILVAAHMGGAAIENSMLGAAHALANPLTAKYGITHGVAVGNLLPHVVRLNRQVAEANDIYHQLKGDHLEERIGEMLAVAGISARLQELGVIEADIPELSENAATQWTGTFNPVSLNLNIISELYRSAF